MISLLIFLAGVVMSVSALRQLHQTRLALIAPELPFVPFSVFWSLAK